MEDRAEVLKELEEKLGQEMMIKLRAVSESVLKFVKSDEKFGIGHVDWLVDPMVEAGFPKIVAVTSILILQLDGLLDITEDGWFKLQGE